MQDPYRERLKLLLAEFPSLAAATQAYSRYVEQLSEQHEPEDMSGLGYQTSVFKIARSFIFCQLRGYELMIISGGRKKASLALLARQVY